MNKYKLISTSGEVLKINTKRGEEVHGVGVDIEDIKRFSKILNNILFQENIFTKKEMEYCRGYSDPEPHLAVRFAGKEAILKALGFENSLPYNKIEILNEYDGAPFVNMKNERLRKRFRFFISLSHSRTKAVAFSLITKEKEK